MEENRIKTLRGEAAEKSSAGGVAVKHKQGTKPKKPPQRRPAGAKVTNKSANEINKSKLAENLVNESTEKDNNKNINDN